MNLKMNNEELLKDILLTFVKYDKSIVDVTEIIANLMIQISMADIDTQDEKDITQSIIDDIENNGETLENALARQGLLMLTWLKSEINE